jgi:four helix bundle protein
MLMGPHLNDVMTEYSRPIPGRLWIIRAAEHLSNRAHALAKDWQPFDRDSIGDQLVRATDSIGLNLSEGYARVHKKERLHFYSWAQGSVEEALFALRRARDRGLSTPLVAADLSGLFVILSKAIAKFAASENR